MWGKAEQSWLGTCRQDGADCIVHELASLSPNGPGPGGAWSDHSQLLSATRLQRAFHRIQVEELKVCGIMQRLIIVRSVWSLDCMHPGAAELSHWDQEDAEGGTRV